MKKRIFSTILLLLLSAVVMAKEMSLYHKVKMNNNTKSKAVEYAVKALSLDFDRKFGIASRKTSEKKDLINLYFNIEESSKVFDQYNIEFGTNKITFNGTDELGLIHAIYTFSEDILGIDPFIHFTNLMPEPATEIKINSKKIISKPFTYTHRGFFINDEDLVTGFRMEKQAYGFNLPFMERVFETMLRAKLTGVIPSTLVLSDEPHLRLAAEMGLYIMHHHAEPLGSVPLYWPKNEAYSWKNNRDEFIKFWTTAIKRQASKNVIWTIGFRGRLDRDFWVDDQSMRDASDEEKAKVINEVAAVQYELIKKLTGNPNPIVTANLRGHVGILYNKGLIKYPESTIIQFTDDGHTGTFLANTWKDAPTCPYAKGVYQHISFHNRRNHMRINIVDPNNMCHQMQMAYDHKLTSLCVLNVGNMKEKVFGMQQFVNYMNDFEKYKDQKNGEYYGWYVKNKYKVESPAIAKVYEDFITTHYIDNEDNVLFGDEYFSFAIENLMRMVFEKEDASAKFPAKWNKQINAKSGFKDQFDTLLDIFIRVLELSSSKWEVNTQRAYNAQKELGGNELDFYIVDAMLPTEKMYNLTSMLKYACKSMKAFNQGNYHDAQLNSYEALRYINGALEVETKIENNHTGYFKDWYRFDQNACTKQIKGYLLTYHDVCINMKYIKLPYADRNSKTESIQYKKEPFFDSKYRRELIYMENAQ